MYMVWLGLLLALLALFPFVLIYSCYYCIYILIYCHYYLISFIFCILSINLALRISVIA